MIREHPGFCGHVGFMQRIRCFFQANDIGVP